jgi:hypothetical protein
MACMQVLANLFNRVPLRKGLQDRSRTSGHRRLQLPSLVDLDPVLQEVIATSNRTTLTYMVAYLQHFARSLAGDNQPASLAYSGMWNKGWGAHTASVRSVFFALRGAGDDFASSRELEDTIREDLRVCSVAMLQNHKALHLFCHGTACGEVQQQRQTTCTCDDPYKLLCVSGA